MSFSYQPVTRTDINSSSALQKEVVWKQLSGDVFRKPKYPLIFSVFIGAGTQVLGCFYLALLSTITSTYSPVILQIQLIVLAFPFFSSINGYVAARIYKFFNGTNWITLAVVTTTFLPCILVGALIVIDICEYIQTEKAIISEIYILLTLWLSLCLPLTLIGSFIGFS